MPRVPWETVCPCCPSASIQPIPTDGLFSLCHFQDILTDLSAESETLSLECEVQDCSAHKVDAPGLWLGTFHQDERGQSFSNSKFLPLMHNCRTNSCCSRVLCNISASYSHSTTSHDNPVRWFYFLRESSRFGTITGDLPEPHL